jgi:hypothetical protein
VSGVLLVAVGVLCSKGPRNGERMLLCRRTRGRTAIAATALLVNSCGDWILLRLSALLCHAGPYAFVHPGAHGSLPLRDRVLDWPFGRLRARCQMY